MYPLFESICIKNAKLMNARFHQDRIAKSYKVFYNKTLKHRFLEQIKLPPLDPKTTYKLKLVYNRFECNWTINKYNNKLPQTLQLVIDNTIDYSLKYTNRSAFDNLLLLKKNADDVLIVKNNLVTESSYANILFKMKGKIVTPKTPLLAGTCRAKLLAENKISAIDILPSDIKNYESFQLINAMNGFDPKRWISVKNITQ